MRIYQQNEILWSSYRLEFTKAVVVGMAAKKKKKKNRIT